VRLQKPPVAVREMPVTAPIGNTHGIPDWEPFLKERENGRARVKARSPDKMLECAAKSRQTLRNRKHCMPITNKRFPARLHVLLARDAKVGLVIRRGPSKSVCAIEWNRRRDTFKLGQWMRGQIYERRSDLSPDGKHFIYFATNGRWGSETKGSWTAVSRVPFLKAVTLLAKGDCWHGGGLFVSDREFWLNDGQGHTMLKGAREVRAAKSYKPKDNFSTT
jgi:hypothetical protein